MWLTTHLESATLIMHGHLRQRLRRAGRKLKGGSARAAAAALFDKGMSTSAALQFEGDFPLKEMHRVLKGKAYLADQALIELVRRADYSRYEPDVGPDVLTEEEWALFLHIRSHVRRLRKQFEKVGIEPGGERTTE
ncbi:hypothetical protein AMYX_13870 [Anaeromyxobacter diazotrophicus]|uniref:Uncharacterized protein n=2 Tax=Anaeromyxobacter diazotrophicus TaxID=2590199 RepID=A0A7I9VJR1_9BACT|nr:hypothetical protein AMYX_13870 [Anaeromyxobacter diazotrophicus]